MKTIPVDTNQLSFLVGLETQPKMDRDTRTQKADQSTGELLYIVQLGVLGPQGFSDIAVTVAGKAPEVTKGQQVSVVELEAFHWTQGNRSGISYRAKDVKPVAASAPAKAAA